MELETLWIPEKDFRAYVWDAKERANLENVEGFTRWVITGENDLKYIVRPITKREEDHE